MLYSGSRLDTQLKRPSIRSPHAARHKGTAFPMPSFGHGRSLGGVQKVKSYRDMDSWSWQQPSAPYHSLHANVFDHSMHSNFVPQLQPLLYRPTCRDLIATSHVRATGTNTPPARAQVERSMVKAQGAFKPTWKGFLYKQKMP